MAEIKLILKRVNTKGFLTFKIPEDLELREQLRKILRTCRDRYSDFVQLTIKPPYKPRTTGKGSQNHHLNGHIIQICNCTGQSYEVIKHCVKMKAVEMFGYPYELIEGYICPKGETECNTEECGWLIEAAHVLAAEMRIILREE